MMTRPAHEEGAALLTVMLLVAVMSALAVGVLDDMRFGLRRSANAETVGQAQWYALGAESLAKARLTVLTRADPQRTSLAGGWNGRVLAFDIDDGLIRARVIDGGACFNLNSVVEGAPEQWSRRPLGVAQFVALAQGVGIPGRDAESLAEALADWVDTDASRNTLGAEDEAYADGIRPYRTGGTLLAEVSELRAIRGFSPAVYARLRPFVCALPTAALSPVNLNTLPPDKAVVLSAIVGLPTEAARKILGARPADGWANADAFWALPALAEYVPSNPVLEQLSVRTRYFDLRAEVAYAGAEVVMTSLFEQTTGTGLHLVARRWTTDE